MKKNLITIIVITALLCSGFYWFEIRPMNIRQNCWEEAEILTVGEPIQVMSFESSGASFDDDNYKIWDRAYRTCLYHNGLNE